MLDFSQYKNVVFHGDWHGNWVQFVNADIRDTLHIQVGDFGIGFGSTKTDIDRLIRLNKVLQDRNSFLLAIRGNHDNPAWFRDTTFSNLMLVKDYTYVTYNSKIIGLVGGAVSIDRVARVRNTDWWDGEGFVLNEDLCKPVDILVTHTTPEYCMPVGSSSIVNYWINEENKRGPALDFPANLLQIELKEERRDMSRLVELMSPKLHLYGHFHESCSQVNNGCHHRLLNIHEMWQYND